MNRLITQTNKRLQEADYLKAVLILLMVAFHLVYIGDHYPQMKEVVYLFHMSSFCVLSGFFYARTNASNWWHRTKTLLIPYLILESGYILMASITPVREHIAQLTPALFFKHLFLSPLGPYWYLHTLLFVLMTKKAASFLIPQWNSARAHFLWLAITLFLYIALHQWAPTLYYCRFFFYGVLISWGGNLLRYFWKSWWSIIPIAILIGIREKYHFPSTGFTQWLLTYLMMGLLFKSYRILPQAGMRILGFWGRNTLVVLFFSPLFTFLSKLYQPFFTQWDPSGILFLGISLIVVMGGCLGVAQILDWLHLSPLMGRKPLLSS